MSQLRSRYVCLGKCRPWQNVYKTTWNSTLVLYPIVFKFIILKKLFSNIFQKFQAHSLKKDKNIKNMSFLAQISAAIKTKLCLCSG